jgi:hypothetical protein
MTPDKIDQLAASARDSVPRLWWALYQGCLQAGFSEIASMALVGTYVLCCGAGVIRPNEAEPPNKEV